MFLIMRQVAMQTVFFDRVSLRDRCAEISYQLLVTTYKFFCPMTYSLFPLLYDFLKLIFFTNNENTLTYAITLVEAPYLSPTN